MHVRTPPETKGVPILGVLPELNRDPLGFLIRVRDRYGGIARMRFGPATVYTLSDPALIEELLIGRYRDCTRDRATRALMPLLGHGLVTSEGEHWKRQRALVAAPLQPKRIADYAATMLECATREFASYETGQVRDVQTDMARLTIDIVGRTLLGSETRGTAAAVSEMMSLTFEYMEKTLRSWQIMLPPWVPTPARHRFRRDVAEFDKLIYAIIDQCRARGTADQSLLGRLARARDENGQVMTDVQLRDEVITMLSAGHETVALTLSLGIFALSSYPKIAQRLRRELNEHLAGRALRFEDLPALPYLQAVVRELLRMYPPVWIFGRETVRSIALGGYDVPTGTQLLISPYVVHHDPRLFADPDRCDPERWLAAASPTQQRFGYFPFGGGPRVCVGSHFANVELALVLATLVQQVELHIVHGYKLKLAPIVTLRPAEPLRATVKRHIDAPTHLEMSSATS